MHKQEFLDTLKMKLSGMPAGDLEDRLNFYGEMIDDRMEDSATEEEAVNGIGSIESIVSQILEETPLIKLARERIKPKRSLTWWEITLLALGSPIWFSLLVTAFSVVLSLYVTLWSLVVSAWSVFASFAACAPTGVIVGTCFAVSKSVPAGLCLIGTGLVCAGAAIFSFYGCKAATQGTVVLTKKILLGIKRCFVGKGAAK